MPPEKWTGRLIGRMHNEEVTLTDLAKEMGVVKAYVSMILHSSRKPKGAQERLENAFQAVLERRKEKTHAKDKRREKTD